MCDNTESTAMEAAYRPPNILRLSGVSLKDYVSSDDLLEAKLLEEVNAPDPEDDIGIFDNSSWDKIPLTFTTLEEWPLSTNLKCWDMDCTFDDRPKFIATHIVENSDGILEIGVKGNFATFNNAARYIESHYADREERLKLLDLLCLVYRLFTGRSVSHIEPAPPKEKKIQYGGAWDDDTYWKKLRELDPVSGLRDHTPGSVKSEQERIRAHCEPHPEPAIPFTTMWSLCDATAPIAKKGLQTATKFPFNETGSRTSPKFETTAGIELQATDNNNSAGLDDFVPIGQNEDFDFLCDFDCYSERLYDDPDEAIVAVYG